MGVVEIITIVLSLVALTVTVIGFFASLKFYRDGMQMQTRADRVLSKIEERASAIQSHVGGMFDKTLDAALARSTPREAEREQSRMLKSAPGGDAVEPAEAVVPEEPAGLASNTELAKKAGQFYAFKKMRVTDITASTARAVFNLGSPGGFNLFDGTDGLLFLGLFPDVEPAEIVARVRVLLNNLEISYKRLDDSSLDLQARDQAKQLLDQISIDLLVSEGLDTDALARKIDEYQADTRAITVVVRTPGEVEGAVAAEFRSMEP